MLDKKYINLHNSFNKKKTDKLERWVPNWRQTLSASLVHFSYNYIWVREYEKV